MEKIWDPAMVTCAVWPIVLAAGGNGMQLCGGPLITSPGIWSL